MNGELVAQARGFTTLAADMGDGAKLGSRDAKVMLSHALAYLRDLLKEIEWAEDSDAYERMSAEAGRPPIANLVVGQPGLTGDSDLPFDCVECGSATGFLCRANLAHGQDRATCLSHLSDGGDRIICRPCAKIVHEAGQQAIETAIAPAGGETHELRRTRLPGEVMCNARSPHLIPGSPDPWTCTAFAGHGGPAHAALDPFGMPYRPSATWPVNPDPEPEPGIPAVAYDGNLCGLANPDDLDRVCTAADGHPEPNHATHGARGRVVTSWPVAEGLPTQLPNTGPGDSSEYDGGDAGFLDVAAAVDPLAISANRIGGE